MTFKNLIIKWCKIYCSLIIISTFLDNIIQLDYRPQRKTIKSTKYQNYSHYWKQIDVCYPQKHHQNNNMIHIPVINIVVFQIFLIMKPYSRKIKNLKFLRFPSTSSKNSRKCSDFVILFLSSICWYAQPNTPTLFVYY